MRAALAVACAVCIGFPAHARVAQMELDAILHEFSAEQIAARRSGCAMGLAPAAIQSNRAAGLQTASVGGYCVTVLTRAGRDGTLGYVRDPRTSQITPAIAFDNGFVGAYLKRTALPAGAPTIATLLPIADRCLDQKESNTDLCGAVGQILGSRAVLGEVVVVK